MILWKITDVIIYITLSSNSSSSLKSFNMLLAKNDKFKQIAELCIEQKPELWKNHESYSALVKRDVMYQLEQQITLQHKVDFLTSRIADCSKELNHFDIKHGLLALVNGESQQVIDGTIGMLSRAIIQNPVENDDLKKLQNLFNKDLSDFTHAVLNGSESDTEKLIQHGKLIFEKLNSIELPTKENIPNYNTMKKMLEMNSEQQRNFAFDQVMSIYNIQDHVEWLKGLIHEIQSPSKPKVEPNYLLFNDCLEPIETDEDPTIFIKALAFFANEKNNKGQFFLTRDEVKILENIGHRLPKPEKTSPQTINLKMDKRDKEIIYGFFYVAWSKLQPGNRGRIYYAQYMKSYFENFKDLRIESIQSALKMPDLDKKARIKSFFLKPIS